MAGENTQSDMMSGESWDAAQAEGRGVVRRIIFDANQREPESKGATFVGEKGASPDNLRRRETKD